MHHTTADVVKRVLIQSDLDVIVARLRAREVAKEMGFSPTDQARISLAAGELARILVRYQDTQGEITISGTIDKQNRPRIQVISTDLSDSESAASTWNLVPKDDTQNQILHKAFALVGGGTVEDRSACITLVQGA